MARPRFCRANNFRPSCVFPCHNALASSSDTSIQLTVAIIGLAGSIGGGLISALVRPRSEKAQTRAQTPPQTQQQPATATAAAASGAAPPNPAAAAGAITVPVKISRSLWWAIAALLLAVTPAAGLGYLCALPGLWIAVRDIRSPGVRRLAWTGLLVAAMALVVASANPHSGFAQASARVTTAPAPAPAPAEPDGPKADSPQI